MDDEIIKLCKKAGIIAAQVRREGAQKLQKPGTSFLETMDFCEERILKLGGQIAWAQMAVNDVAAHFCPLEDDTSTSKEGDLIKIDIGVHINGYIADNAMTVEVGKSTQHKDLIKAAQNALRETIKIVRPGVTLTELGESQMNQAQKLGFTTIRNLCGHTIEQYKVHGGISIPTFANNDKRQIQEGMQIAIEPFITPGQGLVRDKGIPTIFMMKKNVSTRSLYAKKIVNEMAQLNGLPFTTRHLTRKFSKGQTALGLRDLEQQAAITKYPPLAEISGSPVAQFEHSMIVKEKPIVYTRHDEDEW